MKKASTTPCRICGNVTGNRAFVGREMMFGLRETFEYIECGNCGCLQISRIPDNLGKYYPDAYYSFRSPHPVKTFIKGPWVSEPFSIGTAVLRCLNFIPGVRFRPQWMKRIRRSDAVLEVGSGKGIRLMAMRQAGYKDLTGVDPYLSGPIRYPNGIEIFKMEVSDLRRQFDFVMLHHAFEHMADPVKALKDVSKILKAGGTLLIRIPVASSYAWKTYRENWLGLDPPRHLYIHTPHSLEMVAKKANLDIVETFYDGDFMGFVGSEQYAQDIPLHDPRSYLENRRRSIFSRGQTRRFKMLAARMNREEVGDSAGFYLRHAAR